MAKRRFRLRPLTLLLLCVICLGVVFFIKDNTSISNVFSSDRERMLFNMNNFINSGYGKLVIEGQACRIPVLDVNASEIMQLLKKAPDVVCNSKRDWVEVSGSTAKITDWAKEQYGDVQCIFTDIIRETDERQYAGMATTTHTEYNLENSDVVHVRCASKKEITWHKVLMGIRSDQDILDRSSWRKLPNDSLKLNVLIYGFDSLSHNMWKRKLPKTYKYATHDLGGIALNGYNIIGDGTPQALIPILTGKIELELPDTRKRKGSRAQYVNVYPFIWNEFQSNGYVTAWSEDMARIGTFTYRLKGFKEQPVDHYMRTFYVAATPDFERDAKFCYGGMSRYEIILNFVRNLFIVYADRPKFIFAFHSEYSHDSNDWISNADNGTLALLQEFNSKGHLNNTLLILMSDHGSRFAQVRNTQQGKLEERLPGFIFVFPSWFSKRYPEAYANFKKNADRLSTPFDIHETLKSVLHFDGGGMGSLQHRGISLFKEVPLSRSCQDAAIEPHWCACLDWKPVAVSQEIVRRAVESLLNFINSYTSKQRDLCAELRLGKILSSAKLVPNEHLLKFKKNSDYDGFVGDMTADTAISTEIYQVKASFDPGNMIFEASVRFHTTQKRFTVMEGEISRVNKYQHMTHCIEDKDIHHNLRKYCNCIKDLSSGNSSKGSPV